MARSLFAFAWPGIPGLWMGWLILLAIRYGVPALAGNNALSRAGFMPTYTPGHHRAARIHSITAMLALVMSLFLRLRWPFAVTGAAEVCAADRVGMPALGAAVSLSGSAAAALGIAAYAWAFTSFSRTPGGVRVSTGLFRVIRHPIFVSFCVAQVGFCLASCSVPYTLVIAAHVAASVPLLRAEERWCREVWG